MIFITKLSDTIETLKKNFFEKKFFVDISAHFISVILFSLFGLGITVFIISFYGFSALGVFNLTLTIYLALANAVSVGLNFSILNFVARVPSKQLQSSLVNVAILYTVLVSTLGAFLLFFTADYIASVTNIPDLSEGLKYTAPSVVLLAVNKMFYAALNARRSMFILAVSYALRSFCYLFFIIILYYFDVSGKYLPTAFGVSELLIFIVLVLFYANSFSLVAFKKPFLLTKIHLNFIKSTALSTIVMEINPKIDLYFLAFFSNPTLLGVYSFCALIIEGLAQFTVALQSIINPILSRLNNRTQLNLFERNFHKWRPLYYLISICAAILAICGIFVLGIMPFNISINEETYIVLIFLLFGFVFSAPYIPISMIFNQLGKPSLHRNNLLFIALSNLALNAFLVPEFGIYGAAVATSISAIIGVYNLKSQVLKHLDIKI